MEQPKLTTGFNEYGLIYSTILIFVALVTIACMLHPSSDRIMFDWGFNTNLFHFVSMVAAVLSVGLFGVTQFVTFSTRPLWYRGVIAVTLLVGPIYFLMQLLPEKLGRAQQTYLLGAIGCDQSWLTIPMAMIAALLLTGMILRMFFNLQMIRWKKTEHGLQYAAQSKASSRQYLIFGGSVLLLYVIASNSTWFNFTQVFSGGLEVEMVVGILSAVALGFLMQVPTCLAAWFRWSWLSWIVATLLTLVLMYAGWQALKFAADSQVVSPRGFLPLLDFVRPMAGLGLVLYLLYLLILAVSSTLPFAYSSGYARRWDGQATQQSPLPKACWFVLPVLFVLLLVVGWLAPDAINQRFNVAIFASSDRSPASYSEAVLVADLMQFQPRDLNDPDDSPWERNALIHQGDSILSVSILTENMDRPQWPALQRRIEQIQPQPVIQPIGKVRTKERVQAGQRIYNLDGKYLSLDDIPNPSSLFTQIEISDSEITPEQLERFKSRVTIHFERCKFFWDGRNPELLMLSPQIRAVCIDCDFDRNGLRGMLSTGALFQFDSTAKVNAQPLQMYEAVYAQWGIEIQHDSELETWLHRFPMLQKRGMENQYQWYGIDVTEPFVHFPEQLPEDFASPLVLANGEGVPNGFMCLQPIQLGSIELDLIKRYKPEYLVVSSQLDSLWLMAERDDELTEALKNVRYFGCNGCSSQTDLESTLKLFPQLEGLALGNGTRVDVGQACQDTKLKQLLLDFRLLQGCDTTLLPESLVTIYTDDTVFTGVKLPGTVTAKIRTTVDRTYRGVDLLTLLEMNKSKGE